MGKLTKWTQRVSIAVLGVWLIWLTVMQAYLNSRVQPLSQSEMLKEMVFLQQQINSLEDEVNKLEGKSSNFIPFDKSELR